MGIFAALIFFFCLLYLFSCVGVWIFAGGLEQWCPVSVKVSWSQYSNDYQRQEEHCARHKIFIDYNQITIGCQACSDLTVTKWLGLQFPCHVLCWSLKKIPWPSLCKWTAWGTSLLWVHSYTMGWEHDTYLVVFALLDNLSSCPLFRSSACDGKLLMVLSERSYISVSETLVFQHCQRRIFRQTDTRV